MAAVVSGLPASAAQAEITFAPLTYANGDSDKIGAVKAGFICLPSGRLRWGDMKLPRDGQLAGKASSMLKEHKWAAELQQEANYQLQGHLENISLDICIAGLGIGEKKPKGKGKISVSWALLGSRSGEIIGKTISSEFGVNGLDPRRDSLPLEQALLANLEIFLKSHVYR